MTIHRSEPDSAPGEDEPYECRGHTLFVKHGQKSIRASYSP